MFDFCVYYNTAVIAGFMTLSNATSFVEYCLPHLSGAITVVDTPSGEVIDIWNSGKWELGRV